MADVIDGGVAQCLQEVTNRKADFDLIANLPPTPTGQRICNPLSGHFLGCIHSFIFRVSIDQDATITILYKVN